MPLPQANTMYQKQPAMQNDPAKNQFKDILNQIITFLDEGHIWHMNAGASCRLEGLRGWGQWHEAEAKCDSCKRLELTKLISDVPALQCVPSTNTQTVAAAHGYTFPDVKTPDDLKAAMKAHHEAWIEREKRFCSVIKDAIKLANTFDGNLYSTLLCLQKEVENEIFRVGIVARNLWVAGYEGHHLIVVSKWLHRF